MNILFLSHANNNINAGASSIYHMLSEGLEARGHHVDTLHLNDMKLPNHPILNRLVSRFYLPQQISRRAMRQTLSEYDVIMTSNGMAWPLFRTLSAQSKRPLRVNHFHGLTLYDQLANITEAELDHHKVSAFYRLVSGRIYHKWDMAGIAHSDLSVVQNLRDLAYVEAKIPAKAAVRLIPPAVTSNLLTESETISPIETRSTQKILTFSSWGARKGSFYLPGTLRKIRERFPKVELVIGGTGMSLDQARSHFAPEDREAITVLGFISREEQARLYNEAAIFLFPSVSEGFGLALLEAQIFGLAAVTTNTGYGGDFLTDGVDARIVPLTTEHFARGVIALLENDYLRAAIAGRGRTLARNFTREAMAEAYEREFLAAIAKRRARA